MLRAGCDQLTGARCKEGEEAHRREGDGPCARVRVPALHWQPGATVARNRHAGHESEGSDHTWPCHRSAAAAVDSTTGAPPGRALASWRLPARLIAPWIRTSAGAGQFKKLLWRRAGEPKTKRKCYTRNFTGDKGRDGERPSGGAHGLRQRGWWRFATTRPGLGMVVLAYLEPVCDRAFLPTDLACQALTRSHGQTAADHSLSSAAPVAGLQPG
mmetsp:Transcript_4696/g.11044  ORF Transcript_4696/g.11044 Transcript_4696/m.11044 type:complete len:214 (+) Transcript_4696:316-957(+)